MANQDIPEAFMDRPNLGRKRPGYRIAVIHKGHIVDISVSQSKQAVESWLTREFPGITATADFANRVEPLVAALRANTARTETRHRAAAVAACKPVDRSFGDEIEGCGGDAILDRMVP